MKMLLFAGCVMAPQVALAQTAVAPASTVGELVVTAQRRAERLVDVPISVSVSTGEELSNSGVGSSRDLRLITPGLNLSLQGAYAQPTIRGVGTSVVGPGADANVAIYIDGVYQPNQFAALFDFADVSQIQVLKGPQGTLYGRNATGGAIVVSTLAPSFETSGRISASYGRFNEARLSGYINAPLSDVFAASASLLYRSNDGYTRNVVTGSRTSRTYVLGGRGKLLYQPNDRFHVTATIQALFQTDNTAFSYSPYKNNTVRRESVANTFGLTDKDNVALNVNPYSKVHQLGGSLNAEYESSAGTLSSITSWSQVYYPFGSDIDGTELDLQRIDSPQHQETYTQELIYASPAGRRVGLTAGLYYYNDVADSDSTLYLNGVATPRSQPKVRTSAGAAYGELTYNVSDKLHLIGGGRFSIERKHATGRRAGGPELLNASKTWNAFTPRVSVRYDLNGASNVYYTWSRGFKSAVYNSGNFDPIPVNPEKIRASEIGYKYGKNGVLFTASAYLYKYKDIQINAIDLTRGGLITVTNAAEAEIKGVEADLSAPLGDSFKIKGGAAYTDGNYNHFPNAIITTPLPNGGNSQGRQDVSGAQMVRTPKLTAFASINYVRPLPTGSIVANATVSYNDGFYWDPANRIKQPSFTTVNGNVGWVSPSDKWRVTVWGRNLTNARPVLYLRTSTLGETASYGQPRSFGVSVDRSF